MNGKGKFGLNGLCSSMNKPQKVRTWVGWMDLGAAIFELTPIPK